MSGSILALFGVVLAAAIVDLLIPGEEKGGTRQFFYFLTAMAVLLLLLSPFLFLLNGAEEFLRGEIEWSKEEVQKSDFEKQFSEAIANRSAVQLKEGLRDMLQEKYGIAPEQCEITVVLDADGGLSRRALRLKGEGLLRDPGKIQRYLSEQFLCEVEVR